MILPRFPIYIPSKGRAERCLTARFMLADGVPFKVVVEPQEHDAYAATIGAENLLVLPFSNRGVTPARNFIWEHAAAAGAEWHWCFDDNIADVKRHWCNEDISCDAGPALRACEDFTLRYENFAITGLNYRTFVRPGGPAYRRNCHVYSALLIRTALPHRWRLAYNEDTDLCLQVLTDGWCTALINVFMVEKRTTMSMKGGNNIADGNPISYQGDGRLRMARALEATWPGLVTVGWRYGRPQHVVNWRVFTQEWKLRDDVDPAELEGTNEYGLKLKVVSPIQDDGLRELVERVAPYALREAGYGPATAAEDIVDDPATTTEGPATHEPVATVTPAPPHRWNCDCLTCEYGRIMDDERPRAATPADDPNAIPLW